MNTVEVFSMLVAVASAFAAAAECLYAYKGLALSKASLLSDLLSQYSDAQLGHDMQLLREWQHKHGPDFAEQYRDAIQVTGPAPETVQLMDARRRTSQYFKR